MSGLDKLAALIPQYHANKVEMESYKKICDTENAEIKSIMSDLALQHYTVGGLKAVRSIQRRETMNEERLLEIARKYGLDVIRTREYVDFDALEQAIYNGKVSNEAILEMDKAKEVKEVVTLTIKKVKEKKDE